MNSAREIAESFARALRERGTKTVFGLPGGGNNLEVVGALQANGISFVLAHGETAATIMAAAHADLTGCPSAVVVTRGPGAASAVNGAAQAFLDRQAIVILTDAVAATDRARISHQYVDQPAMFAPVTKGSAVLRSVDADRVAAGAIKLAEASPRGPVHIDFDPDNSTAGSALPSPAIGQVRTSSATVRSMVRHARQPVVLLGMGARDVEEEVRRLLNDNHAPVLTTYRAKGVIPESWPNYAGLLTGATLEGEVLEAADLIVAIGLDSVELIPAQWPYDAPIVWLASWADPMSYLPIAERMVGDLGKLVAELQDCIGGDWSADAGRRFDDRARSRLMRTPNELVGISPQLLVQRLQAVAPQGSIATVDAGAHMLVALPLWRSERQNEVIVSSGLATMGFALPAAIGAALAAPGQRILCLTGDGGLGMALAELETVARLGLPITVVVFNDSQLSLIAVKQSSPRHGGEDAVTYRACDFAEIASGFGIRSRVALTASDLDAALADTVAADGPALLDARVDPACYQGVLATIRGERGSTSPESELAAVAGSNHG